MFYSQVVTIPKYDDALFFKIVGSSLGCTGEDQHHFYICISQFKPTFVLQVRFVTSKLYVKFAVELEHRNCSSISKFEHSAVFHSRTLTSVSPALLSVACSKLQSGFVFNHFQILRDANICSSFKINIILLPLTNL